MRGDNTFVALWERNDVFQSNREVWSGLNVGSKIIASVNANQIRVEQEKRLNEKR